MHVLSHARVCFTVLHSLSVLVDSLDTHSSAGVSSALEHLLRWELYSLYLPRAQGANDDTANSAVEMLSPIRYIVLLEGRH